MSRLSRLSFLSASRAKKVFQDACHQYDLVYLGGVSQHSDEHEIVRGFTLSPSHVDRNYCVGTVAGRDIILLQRTDTISFPAHPSRAYTWLILQMDLKHQMPMHVVLNAHKYDEHVYGTLFGKLSHLNKLHVDALPFYEPQFTSTYSIYAPLQHSHTILQVLDAGTANVLGSSYSTLDFELIDDELLVYLPVESISRRDIDYILKAGLWFADQIDHPSSSV